MFNQKNYKDQLLFLPLGGAGEIGMNLNLYYLDGKWLIVDLGAGFADDYYPGVDVIVPDIKFLQSQKENILGIVLTHAHEDHLGAVQYLWQELECVIYATPFTANFLKAKIKDSRIGSYIPINEVAIASSFKLGGFSIEMVPLSHSAPEMQALMIRTRFGNIFHTGDWKLDHNPLIGEVNDDVYLKELGKEGVLALVGDSTNVFNDTASGSEGDLRESLFSLIGECKKLVVVTTFASNLARLETLILAGKANNRKVALAGKSLHRVYEAAIKTGYLADVPEIISIEDIGKYKRENVLIIATGCQGEPMAAINKMVTNTHPSVKLIPGDNVIFSSKVIPGNEKKIFRLFNQFVHLGVEVYTEKDHFVHVSGHPSKKELEWMYNLIKPEVAIPVHGELVHIHEHIRLAKTFGVKNSVQVENGSLVKLAPGKAEIVANVESGYLAIDGYCLIPKDSKVMRTRRKIREDGVIIATLIMNRKFAFEFKPLLNTPGILDPEDDGQLIEMIVDSIEESVDDHVSSKGRNAQRESIISSARSIIRKIIKNNLGKNPIIEINLKVI